MKKVCILIGLIFLAITSVGCKKEEDKITKENTFNQNTIDNVLPMLDSIMLYMSEHDSYYDIQDNECYWNILWYVLVLYEYDNKDCIVTDYTISIPKELVISYAKMLYYDEKLPETDGLEFVKYDEKSDMYEFNLGDRSDTFMEVINYKQSDNGDIDIFTKLCSYEDESIIATCEFVLTLNSEESSYTIEQIAFLMGDEQIVFGKISDFSNNEITITYNDMNFTYKCTGDIRNKLKEKNKDEYIKIRIKNDEVIEDLSNEPIIIIPNDYNIRKRKD